MKQRYAGKFKNLFCANYADLLRYALAVTGSPELAEDLVQETFLLAQEKIGDVLRSPNPRGWLVRALRNIIGNAMQRKRLLMEKIVPDAVIDAQTDQVLCVSDLYAGLIDQEALTLLIWVYCEDMTCQEAADRLGITRSACKKRIQRAKEALRAAIEKNNLL